MAFPLQFRSYRLAGLLVCAVLIPCAAGAQTAGQRYNPAEAAALSSRIATLEEQIRHLNGQVEQLNFQVRRLEDELRRAAADPKYRFQMLGQGATGQSTVGVMRPRQPQMQVQTQPVGQGGIASGPGAQPQSLGQVPGRPLDLSQALGQPLPGTLGAQNQQAGSGGQMFLGQSGQQQNPQLALAPSGDPKDVYDLSYGYILRGEFDTAEASFRQFLAQFPADPLAGNAQYWLGESMFARGMYRDAAEAFLKGYSDYPEGAKAPESLYKLGLSLKELGQADAACSTFAEIPRRYPRAAQAVLERARGEATKSGC